MTPRPLDRYRVNDLLEHARSSEWYAALDLQLDRPVTLTHVPLDGVGAAAVERWRERVRTLASVAHPALSHILDTFHADGSDWVVSERVDGRPLGEAAGRHPFAGSEVVRLGREIAEAAASLVAAGVPAIGLAQADVVLTGTGQVKLAGLWRPRWGVPSEPTAAGDLHALGELLLVAAGVQPAGEAPVGTDALSKQLVPTCGDLAEPLASIAARCLGAADSGSFDTLEEAAAALRQLDTAAHPATVVHQSGASVPPPATRRRRWLAVAAMVLLAAGAIAGWWYRSTRHPLVTAVLPVAPPGQSEQARLAAAAVNDTTTMALATIPSLALVSGREVVGLRRAGRTDAQIARQLAVDELVEVKLSVVEGKTGPLIDLSRRRADDGHTVWSERLQADTWEPAALRDTVSELLTGAYRGDYVSRAGRFEKVSPAAYRLYLTVLERSAAGTQSKDRTEEIVLLRTALADSPAFPEAWQRLAETYSQRYRVTLLPEDKTAYEDALDRAKRVGAPPTVTLPTEIIFLLRNGETTRAADLAEGFVHQNPGNPLAWQLRGEALSQTGRFAEAEQAFARARLLLPSAGILSRLALARSDRGDHTGARTAIAEARAMAGTNPMLTSCEAHIEMYAGNHAVSERLYRGVLEERETAAGRTELGNCLYYQNRFAEAADSYRRALELVPTDFVAMRNLGDAIQALGDRSGATPYYQRALTGAESGLSHGLGARAALETRAVCLAQLGRREDAARAADDVLRANPYHPASFYTAALVAAVSGDRASARAWTRRALDANAPAAWFESPEFAMMAGDAEFRSLLPPRTPPVGGSSR